MKPPEKKPRIAMMCPSCAGALDNAHAKKPFLPFLFKPSKIRCPHCGRNSEYKETNIMAESYQHWQEQLRHQVEASLSYLPTMTREECFAVLNPKHFDDNIHHAHHLADLEKYITQVFKPVLRDRALGHDDCELLLTPFQHHGVAKALNIYGHCGHEHNTEAWTLLITRLGSKEFLTCLTASSPTTDIGSVLDTQGTVSIWPTSRVAAPPAPPHEHNGSSARR